MLDWVLVVWLVALPLAPGATVERELYGVRSQAECESATAAALSRAAVERKHLILASCQRRGDV